MSWANDSIQRTCILAGLLVLLTAPVTMGQDIDTIAPGVKRLDTIPVPEDVAVDSVALPADEVNQVPGLDTAATVIGQASGGDSIAVPESGRKQRREEREIAISSGKALLYSAIIPGGGQFYNRKYWKIPIVYGVFVALGVAIIFNQNYYSEFVRELNYRGDGDPLTVPKYDDEKIGRA